MRARQEPKSGWETRFLLVGLHTVDWQLTAQSSPTKTTRQKASLFDTLELRPAHRSVYQSAEGENRSWGRLPSCRSDDEIQAMWTEKRFNAAESRGAELWRRTHSQTRLCCSVRSCPGFTPSYRISSPSLSFTEAFAAVAQGGRPAGRGQYAEGEARFDKQAAAEGRREEGTGGGAALLYIRELLVSFLMGSLNLPSRFVRALPALAQRRYCTQTPSNRRWIPTGFWGKWNLFLCHFIWT